MTCDIDDYLDYEVPSEGLLGRDQRPHKYDNAHCARLNDVKDREYLAWVREIVRYQHLQLRHHGAVSGANPEASEVAQEVVFVDFVAEEERAVDQDVKRHVRLRHGPAPSEFVVYDA